MKQLIGPGLVAILAFVVRFALPFSGGLDIHIHDKYGFVSFRVLGFWILLAISTIWLAFAALKFARNTSS
jgi:hypothetical protein